MAEQRCLIWKHCHEQSAQWLTEQQRIRDDANRKRSEAAKGNGSAAKDKAKKTEVEQNVLPLNKPEPGQQAKAAASHTNRGAVDRGDKLAKDRLDMSSRDSE